MTHALRLSLFGLLLLPGCGGSSPAAAPKSAADPQAPQARLALDIARQSADLAEAELRVQEQESQAVAGRLKREFELATAKLVQFREVESSRRLKDSELEALRARDQIDDAREELDQLEKLYRGNELADSTKEIVLKRGRRGLERAQTVLALKELQVKTLKDDLLPAELARMQLDADQKKDEMERAARGAEIQLRQKKVALARAQAELQKATAALSDPEKK